MSVVNGQTALLSFCFFRSQLMWMASEGDQLTELRIGIGYRAPELFFDIAES